MKRSFLFLLAGAIAGFVLFAVTEPSVPRGFPTEQAWAKHTQLLGLAGGCLLCGLLGLLSGWLQGSRLHTAKGLGVGLVCGFVFGPLSLQFGDAIYRVLGGEATHIISRGIAWSIFGLLLGLGVAVADAVILRSPSRLWAGVVGGFVGGGIGGVAFEVVGLLLATSVANVQGSGEVGGPSRAVGLTCLCGFIGLFVGVAQALSVQGRLRLIFGRNEYTEWPLVGARTDIGRSELAQIPVFQDPSLAPIHATIMRSGGAYVLHDAGTPIGVGVNGVRVPSAVLRDGDIIQMGSLQFQFLTRNGPVAVPSVQPMPQQAPTSMPQATAQPLVQQAVQPVTQVMAAPQPQSLTLVSSTGFRYPLVGTVDVGREAIQIPLTGDANASRLHARIETSGAAITITDLGSTNGTLVNGNRITQPTILKIGDAVQIGSTQFRVE